MSHAVLINQTFKLSKFSAALLLLSFGAHAADAVTPLPLVCDAPKLTAISAIQGSGTESPLSAQVVQAQGVVTQVLADGYYLQQPPSENDVVGVSTGIRVCQKDHTFKVQDVVTVLGTVEEHSGMTQIGTVTQSQLCGVATSPIVPKAIEMPADGDFEAYEGMLVDLQPMAGDDGFYVSDLYNLSRYGDTLISSGRNLIKPTNQYVAGSPDAIAAQSKNDTNRITLDDGVSTQNPNIVSYLPKLSFESPVRVGDRISSNLIGVINEGASGSKSSNVYRLTPRGNVLVDSVAQPRIDYPEAPQSNTLRVANFNVLNYFNGTQLNDGTIDWAVSDLGNARGADNTKEFARQSSKIVTAIARMQADIVGLLEMENDGWGSTSAIVDLVTKLNRSSEKPGNKEYSFVQTTTPYIGTDVIKVSMLYDKNSVEPVGEATLLTDYPFDEATKKHRPPMIQTFRVLSNDEIITVVINHFKSKGSSCETLGDATDLNGQGNCNRQRVAAAETLGKYLQANYAEQKVLMLGDYNAYAKEDPILVLTNDDSGRVIEKSARNAAGEYSAEVTDFRLGYQNSAGVNPISYVYSGESGALDHALASPALASKITQVNDWHINAFELAAEDYNQEYKTSLLQGYSWDDRLVREAEPFRSSDHDPVLVDIALAPKAQPVVQDDAGSFGLPMFGLGLLAVFGRLRRKRQ